MKPEHKKYIEENIDKESVSQIAKELGLKERKIRKYLENRKEEKKETSMIVETRLGYLFRNKKLLILIAVLLTLAVYSNIITGKFVWDDQTIVVRNDAIKNFSNTPYIFKHEFAEKANYGGNIYRPIQEFSFMIDYFLWGLDPIGFHVTNILLQIACVVLIFYLVFIISGSEMVAFVTAVIFGVHPINTEAVSYISGRSDPIYFLFLLAAFIFYIKAKNLNKPSYLGVYISSLLFYVFSLLSRETTIVFPLLLIAYEKCILRVKKVNWHKLLPFFVILILYSLLRLKFIDFDAGKLRTFNLNVIIFTDIKIVFQYLRLLLFPFGLHMERIISVSNSIDNMVIVSLMVVIPLVIFTFRLRNKRKDLFFWILWFIILLLPHLNLVGLNAMFAEHWIYGAAVGIYAIFAILLSNLMRKGKYGLRISCICLVGAIMYFSSLTFIRNFDWRDEPSIYLNTLKYTKSARVISNLGVYYDINKQYDKAIEIYKEALAIKPNVPLYHNNIGIVYLKNGNIKKANYHWKKSLSLDPNQPEIKRYLKNGLF